MFAFIFPFTGLSSTTVLIGLVAYSLVILVRNFLAGLQARARPTSGEAGAGDGLRAGCGCSWQVELPAGAADVHGRPADRHRLHGRADHRRACSSGTAAWAS